METFSHTIHKSLCHAIHSLFVWNLYKETEKKNPFHGRHTHLASVKFILFYENFHLFFSILISIKLFIHEFLVIFCSFFPCVQVCVCSQPQNFPCGRHSNSGSHTVFRLHSGTMNVYACTYGLLWLDCMTKQFNYLVNKSWTRSLFHLFFFFFNWFQIWESDVIIPFMID